MHSLESMTIIVHFQLDCRQRGVPMSPLMFSSDSTFLGEGSRSSSSTRTPQTVSPPVNQDVAPPTPLVFSPPTPQIASLPREIVPDLKYVTISGESLTKPSVVENMMNITQKSKEVGRRGTKRRALVYEGPSEENRDEAEPSVTRVG